MKHTIEVPISSDLLRVIDARAKCAGLSREEYIRMVLSRDVNDSLTLARVLAPFRAEVAASGIPDEDLNILFEQAREEAFRESIPGTSDPGSPADGRCARLYDLSSGTRTISQCSGRMLCGGRSATRGIVSFQGDHRRSPGRFISHRDPKEVLLAHG